MTFENVKLGIRKRIYVLFILISIGWLVVWLNVPKSVAAICCKWVRMWIVPLFDKGLVEKLVLHVSKICKI